MNDYARGYAAAHDAIFTAAEKQADMWLKKGFSTHPQHTVQRNFLAELERTVLQLEPE